MALSGIWNEDNEDMDCWESEIDGFEYSTQDILFEESQSQEEYDIRALGEVEYFGSDVDLSIPVWNLRRRLSRKENQRSIKHALELDKVESLRWKYASNSQSMGLKDMKGMGHALQILGNASYLHNPNINLVRLSEYLVIDEGLIDAIEESKARRNRKRKRFGII